MRTVFIFFMVFLLVACQKMTSTSQQSSRRDREGEVNRDRTGGFKDLKEEGENQNSYEDRPFDLLFVLDTSEDMRFYLTRAFEHRFLNFLSPFEDKDWRVLITHTDVSNSDVFLSSLRDKKALNGAAMNLESASGGKILKRRFIDPDLKDYEQVFYNTLTYPSLSQCRLNPPFCHGALVQPLRALSQAFSANQDIIREEADLVALILTNTDEEPLKKPKKRFSPEEVISDFQSVYGSEKRFFVFGLIIVPEDEECKKQDKKAQPVLSLRSNHYGHSIQALSRATGGEVFSICEEDYTALSNRIVQTLNGEATPLTDDWGEDSEEDKTAEEEAAAEEDDEEESLFLREGSFRDRKENRDFKRKKAVPTHHRSRRYTSLFLSR